MQDPGNRRGVLLPVGFPVVAVQRFAIPYRTTRPHEHVRHAADKNLGEYGEDAGVAAYGSETRINSCGGILYCEEY